MGQEGKHTSHKGLVRPPYGPAKEEKERFEKIRRGEKVDDEDDDEEENMRDFQEIEVFPGGDEVATIIAEDMWQNAIKYYSRLTCTRPHLVYH